MPKKIILLMAALSVAALTLLSCGKKGPLKLEPELLPLEITQLHLSQSGTDIRLQWTFPGFLSDTKTAADVNNVTKIYIYYSGKEIPENKFGKKAILLKKRKIADLGKKNNSFFIDIPFKTGELEDKTHHFAVLYYYGKKKSALSKIESIKTIIPVKAVKDLSLIKENKIVKLKWSKPALNISGKTIPNISGYNVYRKIIAVEDPGKKEQEFNRINKDSVLQEYYEDIDTGIDGVYYYYISTKSSTAIESEPSNTASIEITDTFPPEIPQNLVVFKHRDHLFLTWEKVEEKDLAFYRVYRKSSGDETDEFKRLADKVTRNFFKDTNVSANVSYSYYVTAVDSKENESKKSNIVRESFK